MTESNSTYHKRPKSVLVKKCLDNYKNQVLKKAKQNDGEELFNLVFKKMKNRPEKASSK